MNTHKNARLTFARRIELVTDIVDRKLTQENLLRAMQDLTEEQRHVLSLRFGSDMPIQDVARALGKSEGAVKQLQARAVAALARKLSPKAVD